MNRDWRSLIEEASLSQPSHQEFPLSLITPPSPSAAGLDLTVLPFVSSSAQPVIAVITPVYSVQLCGLMEASLKSHQWPLSVKTVTLTFTLHE